MKNMIMPFKKIIAERGGKLPWYHKTKSFKSEGNFLAFDPETVGFTKKAKVNWAVFVATEAIVHSALSVFVWRIQS